MCVVLQLAEEWEHNNICCIDILISAPQLQRTRSVFKQQNHENISDLDIVFTGLLLVGTTVAEDQHISMVL